MNTNLSLYHPDPKTLYSARLADGWWMMDKFGPLHGPYATAGDVAAAIRNEDIPGRHPSYGERGFQPGCGCCAGPEHDRCTCHIHQDIRMGRRAGKCSLHREG